MDPQEQTKPTSQPIILKSNVPDDSLALGLSIAGLVCSVGGIIGLGLSIAGLIYAKKGLKAFQENKQLYLPSADKTANSAKICAIIGLIWNGMQVLLLILTVVFILIFGVASVAAFYGR